MMLLAIAGNPGEAAGLCAVFCSSLTGHWQERSHWAAAWQCSPPTGSPSDPEAKLLPM